MISLDKAINDPVIGVIIKENPDIFAQDQTDNCSWKEELTLFVFMLHEWQKGDDSFWKPYLDLMPDVVPFCDWSESDVAACQDFSMRKANFLYRRDLTS